MNVKIQENFEDLGYNKRRERLIIMEEQSVTYPNFYFFIPYEEIGGLRIVIKNISI